MTSDNNFIIKGKSEAESVVEVFINEVFVDYGDTDIDGNWELDLRELDQKDGVYIFKARAIDLSDNTGEFSYIYTIEINTKNSDLDEIPDICDDDNDNDGYKDVTQTQKKIGYGISPDGDGINDLFEFKNIEDYPNSKLSIYSRSGGLVYKDADYKNTWDGTSQNISGREQLPDGSYFFVLDLKGTGDNIVKGWIYIRY